MVVVALRAASLLWRAAIACNLASLSLACFRFFDPSCGMDGPVGILQPALVGWHGRGMPNTVPPERTVGWALPISLPTAGPELAGMIASSSVYAATNHSPRWST